MEMPVTKLIFKLVLLYCITFQGIQAKFYKYVMLTAPFEPMVSCNIGDTEKSQFKGLDIEMFNKVASQLNWSDDDFSYECINYNDMSDKLQQTDKYIGFVGGLTIDPKREQDGFVFSYPMWNAGASIILYNKNDFWLQVEGKQINQQIFG